MGEAGIPTLQKPDGGLNRRLIDLEVFREEAGRRRVSLARQPRDLLVNRRAGRRPTAVAGRGRSTDPSAPRESPATEENPVMYAVEGYGVLSWVIGGMIDRIRGVGVMGPVRSGGEVYRVRKKAVSPAAPNALLFGVGADTRRASAALRTRLRAA